MLRRNAMCVGTMVLMLVAIGSCERAAPPPFGEVEIIATVHPPTWFEDGWSFWEASPDGMWGLFGARFGFELYDLASGEEDPDRYRSTLEDVLTSTFHPDGGLVRLASLDGEVGWYLETDGDHILLPVPPDVFPRWSPDGSQVAFYRGGQERFFVGDPEDPREYEVDGVVTGLAWSNEGDQVYALVCDPDGVSSLMRVDEGDGDPTLIRGGLDAPPRFNSIGVSPVGGHVFLALVGEDPPDPEARHDPDADRDTDIYSLELGRGRLAVVVEEPGDDFFPHVAGGYLYWTHNDLKDQVAVIPAEGGKTRVIVEDAQIPYWSADGSQLGFTYGPWRIADWGLNLDAGVVDLDADANPISEPTPIVVGYHEDFTPAWSPDGRWMVYHSHRSDGPVAAYGSEGSTDDLFLRSTSAPMDEEIRLTDFGWEVGMADWAPDSRRIVFDSWERGGTPGISKPWIATIDPESGEPVSIDPLPLPPGMQGSLLAAWSPVSEDIAVVERVEGQRMALWVTRPDGSAMARILSFASSTYGGVDWMLDGEHLVFSALTEGQMRLYRIPKGPGRPQLLSDDDANLIHPQLSPDGRWIAATRVYRTKELRRASLQ